MVGSSTPGLEAKFLPRCSKWNLQCGFRRGVVHRLETTSRCPSTQVSDDSLKLGAKDDAETPFNEAVPTEVRKYRDLGFPSEFKSQPSEKRRILIFSPIAVNNTKRALPVI